MIQESINTTSAPRTATPSATSAKWKPVLLALCFSAAALWMIYTRLGLRVQQNLVYEHVLAVTVRSPIDNVFRLFVKFDNPTGKWMPSGEVYKPATLPGQEQTLRFTLPDQPFKQLRLYLGNRAGVSEITGLALVTRSGNTCTWNADELAQVFTETTEDVIELSTGSGRIRITTGGPNASIIANSFTLEEDCDLAHMPTAGSRLRWFLAGAVLWIVLSAGWILFQQHGASLIDLVMFTAFLFLLTLPFIGSVSGLGNSLVSSENRPLATLPDTPDSLRELPGLPTGLTAYFGDHFGWRSEMIFLSNLFKVYILKSSPLPAVVVGDQGWLYYTGDNQILDYQGIAPFTKERRNALYDNLEETSRRLEEQGIDFLMVVTPIKPTIYPEFLPPEIKKISDESRVDMLLRYNQNHANFPVLDLRPTLIEKKGDPPLYFHTDTHWNAFGGFYAYQEIVNRLSTFFPGLKPHALSEYAVSSTSTNGRDLARLMMMHKFFKDTEYYLGPLYPQRAVEASMTAPTNSIEPAFAREVDDSELPTAVMFHDSYAFTFIPWLSEHFERIVYVWSYNIDWDLIAHEKPDIVILQFLEGRIEYLDQ